MKILEILVIMTIKFIKKNNIPKIKTWGEKEQMRYLCETCMSKPECDIFCIQHLNFLGMIIRKIRSYPNCKIARSYKETYPTNYDTIKRAIGMFGKIEAMNKNSGKKVIFNRDGKWKR